MATILFTWELGAGLGHMLPMRPLAEALARAGHRVTGALRHLEGAARVFAGSRVSYLQAPFKATVKRYFPRTLAMPHVMANVGWGRFDELFGLACAWRNLFELVRPDLIVFDHSPTALLASRGLGGVRRALMGNGFFCPPDGDPMPLFPANRPVDEARRTAREARLREDEAKMVGFANRVLDHWHRPPLRRLGQIYSEVDETFLTTFPELDQYGERPGVRYWGPVAGHAGGKKVEWPQAPGLGSGKRVYAYLKDSPLVPTLLEALSRRGHSAVVYCDGVAEDVRREFASPTMRFEDERLDLAQVGRECDLAVHNANGGTTAELLLAGKPVLLLPLVLEQVLTARAVERLGAGESVTAGEVRADGGALGRKLDALVGEERYGAAARAFAAKYAGSDPAAQRREMLSRAEALLPIRPVTLRPRVVPAAPAAFRPVPGAAQRRSAVSVFRG